MEEETQELRYYMVVRNSEEQYSIWPVELPEPHGWIRVRPTEGTKAECLEYIENVWSDLTPASVRARRRGPMAS
jgi:MbtH protein